MPVHTDEALQQLCIYRDRIEFTEGSKAGEALQGVVLLLKERNPVAVDMILISNTTCIHISNSRKDEPIGK